MVYLMIYQLFNEFQKKIKINDSSLLIFLFKKFIKINIKTPLSSLSLLITHFTQDIFVMIIMIFYLKNWNRKFSRKLEQFEFEQHIRYETMSFYQNICPGFRIMIVILKCCTCNNPAARYRYI